MLSLLGCFHPKIGGGFYIPPQIIPLDCNRVGFPLFSPIHFGGFPPIFGNTHWISNEMQLQVTVRHVHGLEQLLSCQTGSLVRTDDLVVENAVSCLTQVDVSKNGGTPKWMVKIRENPIKMDDLGVYHFFWKHPGVFLP